MPGRAGLLAGACLLAAAAGPPARAGEVSGRLELRGKDGVLRPAAGAVISIPGVPTATAPAAAPTLASRDKRFDPHVVAVPRRSTVVFPNLDKIFHNVFSRTPGSEFDLGLYRGGKSRSFQFTAPGLVRIYCNIHSEMAAYIMVVDGSAFAVADAEGQYRIAGVPDGHREVRVWHEKVGETTATVDVAAGRVATLDLVLDASTYRDQPHKNKYGEDYPPATHDADRY
jgi:plastocyanin